MNSLRVRERNERKNETNFLNHLRIHFIGVFRSSICIYYVVCCISIATVTALLTGSLQGRESNLLFDKFDSGRTEF